MQEDQRGQSSMREESGKRGSPRRAASAHLGLRGMRRMPQTGHSDDKSRPGARSGPKLGKVVQRVLWAVACLPSLP